LGLAEWRAFRDLQGKSGEEEEEEEDEEEVEKEVVVIVRGNNSLKGKVVLILSPLCFSSFGQLCFPSLLSSFQRPFSRKQKGKSNPTQLLAQREREREREREIDTHTTHTEIQDFLFIGALGYHLVRDMKGLYSLRKWVSLSVPFFFFMF
jgi:hypothetical protein